MKQQLAASLVCGCLSAVCCADALWQIEIEEIKRIAIQAVHEKYPDLPLHDLAAETGVTVMCGGHQVSDQNGIRPARRFECQAMISVSPRSTVIEKRYKDENGNCQLLRSREPITVHVFEDRTTRVGGRGAVKKAYQLIDCPEDLVDFRAIDSNPGC